MNLMGKSWKDIKKCPACRSKNVVVATYRDGSRCLECEGCNSVICEIPQSRKAVSL